MFRLAAIVAVASLTMVACNNNKAAEEPAEDTTAIEQIAEEEMVADIEDTIAVVEETPAPTIKKTVKKTETKPTEAGLKEQDNSSKITATSKVAEGTEVTKTDAVKRTGRR